MRLSDIPEEKLEAIRKFALEHKDKVAVTSKDPNYKTLPDLIEEKFGVRLSHQQVYTILKGERRYSVRLDVDVIRELEERFGSVSKGLRKMLKFYKAQKLPDHLKRAHRILLEHGKDGLTGEEVSKVLEENGLTWEEFQELAKRGYIIRWKDGKYYVYEFRRDPLLEFAFGLGGG